MIPQQAQVEEVTPSVGMQPLPALVLDAHLKSSLAAIRSLGRRGIPVIAGSHRGAAMGLYSRYIAERFVYPWPLEDRAGFVDAIARQLGPGRDVVLLPFSDPTLLPLLEEKWLVRRLLYRAPTDEEHFAAALSKACTLELAKQLDIEAPATWFCAAASDIASILPGITFPVVLKPRRSIYWKGNTGLHKTASFAFSPEDLKTRFAALHARTGDPPLIQEFVRGEEGGVEYLCEHGEILAACAHRRIRSVSPAGGPGAVKETVPLSYHGMEIRARRLVSALRWSGPIMVEFKIDSLSGVPRLMEINGRFWGSLPLAVTAGVDFPYLFYRLVSGLRVNPCLKYREGVVSRHFLSDIKNLVAVLWDKDPIRAHTYPPRLRAVKDFLCVPNGCQSDVLDSGDLKPAVAEAIDTLSRVVGLRPRR